MKNLKKWGLQILATVLLATLALAQAQPPGGGLSLTTIITQITTTSGWSSDGTTTTTSQNVTLSAATAALTISGASAFINMNSSGGEYRIANKAVLFGGTTSTFVRGLAPDTGGVDVGVELVNDEQLTTAGDVAFRVRNGEAGAGPIVFDVRANGVPVLIASDQSADCDNAATGNATVGKVCIQAGQGSMTLTNSSINAASIISLTNQSDDATCLNVFAAAPGAGSVVIGCSGAAVTATANMVVNFVVIN